MLDSVSEDTTSDVFDVSMRKKLSAELLLEDVLGTATVGFKVSNDDINYVTYNRLTTNATDSNTQYDTRVASVTLSAGTPSAMVFFPDGDYFKYIKAVYTGVTGGIVDSSIDTAGTGYSEDDVLTIADGTGGTITVLTVGGSGEVLTYEVTTPGSGYTIATHAASGGDGSDFVLSVDSVNAGSGSVFLQDID